MLCAQVSDSLKPRIYSVRLDEKWTDALQARANITSAGSVSAHFAKLAIEDILGTNLNCVACQYRKFADFMTNAVATVLKPPHNPPPE